MSNFNKGTNLVVFGLGLLIALFVAAAIIPGVDFLAWHFLRPVGFWQEIILIIIEAVTFVPRIFIATFLFAAIGKFAAEIA